MKRYNVGISTPHYGWPQPHINFKMTKFLSTIFTCNFKNFVVRNTDLFNKCYTDLVKLIPFFLCNFIIYKRCKENLLKMKAVQRKFQISLCNPNHYAWKITPINCDSYLTWHFLIIPEGIKFHDSKLVPCKTILQLFTRSHRCLFRKIRIKWYS